MAKNAKKIKQRLEHLRGELRAERISYDELHELQSLAVHIPPGDVELLEPAGVPEERSKTVRDIKAWCREQAAAPHPPTDPQPVPMRK